MNACFRLLAVVTFGIISVVASAQEQPNNVDRDEVLKQIERLSSSVFQTREAAEQKLWEMGPSIEPILAENQDRADFEARQRIANVRRKFTLGLTPDLPAHVQKLIVTALESGQPAQRIQATVSLAQQGHFKTAELVLKRVRDPSQRFSFFSQLNNAVSQRPMSKELDDFYLKLMELAVDEPPRYRVQIFQTIVRSNYLRKRNDEAWLRRLVNTLADFPTEARYSLIMGYSFEQSVVHKLTSQELLPLWINMVASEEDRNRRSQLIAKAMGARIPTWLGGVDPFGGRASVPKPEIDIQKLFADLNDQGKIALLDYASNIGRGLAIIHDKLGDEYLLKICVAHKNAARRGHLLGQLSSLQDWPKSGKEEHKILALLDREQDAEARQHLITGFVHGMAPRSRTMRSAPKELIDGLWEKLTPDEEEAWQLVAILNTYDAPNLFANKHSKETIERLLRLATTASQLEVVQLIQAPVRQRYFAKELSKHGLAFDLLKTVRLARQPTIAYQVSRLLASPHYTEAYDTDASRKELLDLCLDDESTNWRYHLVAGIVRNQPLLTQLLDDGHYETIANSLNDGADADTKESPSYANLIGSFYASNATVRHLVHAGNVGQLLALKETGTPAKTFDVVLGRIVQSDEAVSAIFDNGQWDRLNDVIDAIESDSQRLTARRNLMSRKAFAGNLAERKLLVSSLHRFSQDKAWVDGRLYLSLIKNISIDQAQNEPQLPSEFWVFANDLEENNRLQCVESLLTSSWFVPVLDDNDELTPVLDSLKEAIGSDRLYSIIRRLARDKNCVAYFENARLDSLVRLGQLLDAAKLAEFYQSLGSSSYIQRWLDSDGQPANFIHALQQIESEEIRSRFFAGLLTSGVLRRAKDNDLLAPQFASFIGKQPKDHGTRMAIVVLSQDGLGSKFAEQDLSSSLRGDLNDAVREAVQDKAWARRPNHWINLIENLNARHVKHQPEFATQVWKLASESHTFSTKMAEAFLTSSWFVEQIQDQGQLPMVLATLKKQSRPHYVSSIAMQYAQSAYMVRELDDGHATVFLGLCSLMDQGEAERITRFAGSYSNVETWFATSQQPEKLFRVFDSIPNQEQREAFAQSLLGSGVLYHQRDNKQLVPKVIEYTKKHSDRFQLRVAINLLRQYATNNAASQTELPAFLISKVEQDTLDPELLGDAISTPILKKLIAEKQLQRKIIDFAFAVEDHDIRRDCIRSVVANSTLQSHVTDAEIKMIFDDAQERGPSQLRFLIRRYPYLIERMIEDGAYDAFYRIAIRSDPNDRTSSTQWAFYCNPAVVKKLRRDNRKPSVLVRLMSSRDPNLTDSRLVELSKNTEAATWVLESYGWKPFGDALERVEPRRRIGTIGRMFQATDLFAILAESGRLNELIEEGELRSFIISKGGFVQMLRSRSLDRLMESGHFMDLVQAGYENADGPTQRMAAMYLGGSRVRSIAVESEHGQWLLDVLLKHASQEPFPQAEKQNRRKALTSPRGMPTLAIRVGNWDAAEKMLLEFADDDRGRLRLVRFLANRQRAAEQSTGEFELSASAAARLEDDQRLAFYWARSQHEFDKARSLADQIGDAALSWSCAIEQHDWDRLRDMPVCKTKTLPVPRTNNDINPIHRKIEQLGFLITLRQITSDSDTSATRQQLRDWIDRHPKDLNCARYGADALLGIGQPEEALALLNQQLPLRSFYWHRFRLDFQAALDQLDWSETTPPKLYERLSSGAQGPAPSRTKGRGYMVQVAKLLRDAGMQEDLQEVLATLHDYANDASFNKETRAAYLHQLAAHLYKHDFGQFSREVISSIESETAPEKYFREVYADEQHRTAWTEAKVWWVEFESRYPDESVKKRLKRIDDAMTASTKLAELRPFPDSDGVTTGSGVPVTRFRYGLDNEARTIASSRKRLTHADHVLIGRTFWRQEKYADAAEAFYEAYQVNPYDLTRLFLAGHCWQQAGRDEKGSQLKLMARTLALELEAYHGLAIGIEREGLKDDAMEIYRALLGSAPPSHSVYIHTLRQIALNTETARDAYPLWREYALYHMRPIQYYYDLDVWIETETRLRTLQAALAIEQGDIEQATSAWQNALAINPSDLSITETLVPSLRQSDETDLANELLTSQHEYLQQRAKRFPSSPKIAKRLQATTASETP